VITEPGTGIHNLINNAIEAMETTGMLPLKSGMSQAGEQSHINISDTGPGTPVDCGKIQLFYNKTARRDWDWQLLNELSQHTRDQYP
jgi:hypothetical protein